MKQPLQVMSERVGNEFKDIVQLKFTSKLILRVNCSAVATIVSATLIAADVT